MRASLCSPRPQAAAARAASPSPGSPPAADTNSTSSTPHSPITRSHQVRLRMQQSAVSSINLSITGGFTSGTFVQKLTFSITTWSPRFASKPTAACASSSSRCISSALRGFHTDAPACPRLPSHAIIHHHRRRHPSHPSRPLLRMHQMFCNPIGPILFMQTLSLPRALLRIHRQRLLLQQRRRPRSSRSLRSRHRPLRRARRRIARRPRHTRGPPRPADTCSLFCMLSVAT